MPDCLTPTLYLGNMYHLFKLMPLLVPASRIPSTKIDCPGPLDNLHVIRKTDNHSGNLLKQIILKKNVVLYSRLSIGVGITT